MINFGPVESHLFVGNTPQSEVDVARLKQLGVSAVLSLQSDQDFKAYRINWKKLLAAYQRHDIVVQRFPVIDFNERDLGNKVAEAAQALHQLWPASELHIVRDAGHSASEPGTVDALIRATADIAKELQQQ